MANYDRDIHDQSVLSLIPIYLLSMVEAARAVRCVKSFHALFKTGPGGNESDRISTPIP